MIDLSFPTGAIFSPDGRYRYALWRVWSQVRPPLMFIGLNPSRATALVSDPTVTRCMTRAQREGYGGLLVGNLFALVSTDPQSLLNGGDTIGEETDAYLRQMIEKAERVLCGWGSFKPVRIRAATVRSMIKEPYCLGVNADGQPKHPLYIGYFIPMVKMGGGNTP
jgi:hypothetical protein